MKNLKLFPVVFSIYAIIANPVITYAGGGHDHGHGHGHGEDHEEGPAKGPHGGKLLSKDDFSIELTIFEKDTPPEYRVYAYHGEEEVSPDNFKVSITLKRLMRDKEIFEFFAEKNYLKSNKIVEEPHSFGVFVAAEFKGKQYSWEFESHEGRTELSNDALKLAGLEFDTAGPGEISINTRVFGRLLANENKVAHLTPRFPGILKEVKKNLGDSVAKGEPLAIVESNQNLQPYEIRSLTDGVVIQRHATIGEFVNEEKEIFVVADLTELWADFQVYKEEVGGRKAGQKIKVDLGAGEEIDAIITYVSPIVDQSTQSKLIRAVLPNTGSSLRPGLFISGMLSSPEGKVPLVVKRDAIQTFRDWDVVYITDGHSFQAMPVELGKKDSKYVEILSGLKENDRYVSKNSFIIKADIEKSAASHDH